MLLALFHDVDDDLSDHNVEKISGLFNDFVTSYFTRISIGITLSLLLNFVLGS